MKIRIQKNLYISEDVMLYHYFIKENLHVFEPESEMEFYQLCELAGDDILYQRGYFHFIIPDNQEVGLEYVEELKKMLGAT